MELLAVAMFMFSDMLVTVMSRYRSYPVGELLVFRTLFGLVPLVLFAYFKFGPEVFKTKKPKLHFMRSGFWQFDDLWFFSLL